MKILVTGATGLIGRKLIHKLQTSGHTVFALARSPEKLIELPDANVISWSDDKIPDLSIMDGCDAVVHLAGEGIADKRWTSQRKKRLWDSRIVGTQNLIEGIARLSTSNRPKTFISGSAIGYYEQGDNILYENSPPGKDFLSNLCVEWENAAREVEKLGARTVLIRTGLVLAKDGGVLQKTGPVVLGNGQQWLSWIHIEDMVRFIFFALENTKLNGPYNLTAPYPVTNLEFTKKVARLLNFPFTVSAPSFVLKLALGEMSEAILSSQKVTPQKILSSGFIFKYEQINAALESLIGKDSILDNYFTVKQFIPLKRKEIFSFFSRAENLEMLTPPWLNFHIQKISTAEVEKGTLIDYKLKIHGIPVKWRTLISEWNPEESFVDNQLKGPYKKWHHLHTFEDVNGGTIISDDVTFQAPGWIFGKILIPFIRKDIQEIFKFRQTKIKQLSTVDMKA